MEARNIDGPDSARESGSTRSRGRLTAERDDAAIGAECRTFDGETFRQDPLARTIRPHDAQRKTPPCETRKGNQISTRRPDWRAIAAIAKGDATRAATGRTHHVELGRTTAIRIEDDLASIRAEAGAGIDCAGTGDLTLCARSQVDNEDIRSTPTRRREDNLPSIGGEARREGDTVEFAQHALAARTEIERINARAVIGVGHERNLIAHRIEARRQCQPLAGGQNMAIGAS